MKVITQLHLDVPRRTFYGKVIYNQPVNLLEIEYAESIPKLLTSNPSIIPITVFRHIYLTDEELVIFKLSNYLDDIENLANNGYTYLS